MINRRDALKTIGGLAGAAGLAKLLPGCSSDSSGPTGITTIVYLMLENRSYDHYFGARGMLEGKPGDGLPTGGASNLDLNGQPVASYHPDINVLCDPDPPHDWDSGRIQWNNGKNDGFVIAHQMDHPGAIDPMQYLTRNELPTTWALADAYTTCDRWFAAILGPTLPNRAYWHVGTSLGIKTNQATIDSFSNGLPVPSIYNRLDAKHVDWCYYYGSIPVVSLIGNQGPYQLDLGPTDGTGRVRRFGDAGGGIGQFFDDCKKGKLPSVVYIDPAFYINDDHPPIHPINGQMLISAVYRALATSPQWKNCMLVVTYDEWGGFYDHVSPPQTADDTLEKYQVDGFKQLGFRVPAMVIGPYAKQGYVSSVEYNHTSALKHLQNTFDLDPLNMRVDAANDLMDCIDMDRLAKGQWAKPIELPTIDVDAWPQDPNKCTHAGGFRTAPGIDPISAWANRYPYLVKDYDARAEIPQYLEQIRSFLRESQRATTLVEP